VNGRSGHVSVYLTMTGVMATIDDGAGTTFKRTNVIFDEDQQDWDTRPDTKS
jgi:hypothetical protein